MIARDEVMVMHWDSHKGWIQDFASDVQWKAEDWIDATNSLQKLTGNTLVTYEVWKRTERLPRATAKEQA